MKQTARNRRNTRSGVPGRLRSCRRYLMPRACRARRRSSSGTVSLLPIPAIIRERVARSTMSGICCTFTDLEEGRRRQWISQEVPSMTKGDRSSRRGAGSASSMGSRRGRQDRMRFSDSRSRPTRIPPAGCIRRPRGRRNSNRSP